MTYNQTVAVENRLESVQKVGTGTTTFGYDAAGQRVRTTEPGASVVISFPFPGEEEVSGSTTTRRTTYTIAGQAVAVRVLLVGGNNNVLHLHNDHLGSNSVMSYSSSAAEVSGSRTRYLPFGAWRTAPTQTYTDRGYTGQLEDMELGLYYYNARYYIPGIGRFASADTIVPQPGAP